MWNKLKRSVSFADDKHDIKTLKREALLQTAIARALWKGLFPCILLHVVHSANLYQFKISIGCIKTPGATCSKPDSGLSKALEVTPEDTKSGLEVVSARVLGRATAQEMQRGHRSSKPTRCSLIVANFPPSAER